jgi:prepilin signal peptidase PulO-like enzyme (type II secretory pathway)
MGWIAPVEFLLVIISPVVGMLIAKLVPLVGPSAHGAVAPSDRSENAHESTEADARARLATSGSVGAASERPLAWWSTAAAVAVTMVATSTLPAPHAWIGVGLGWACVALAVTDAAHLVVPNLLIWLIGTAGLIEGALTSVDSLLDRCIGCMAGLTVLWSVQVVMRRMRGYAVLGSGDVKLIAALGTWVGWQPLPFVCLVASVFAMLCFGARALATGGQVGLTDRIPFVAFLAPSGWLTWFGLRVAEYADLTAGS